MEKMAIQEFEGMAESVAQLQRLDGVLVRLARVDRAMRDQLGRTVSGVLYKDNGIPVGQFLSSGILGGLLVNAAAQGLLARRAMLVAEIGDVVDLPPAPDFSHLGADGEFDADQLRDRIPALNDLYVPVGGE